MRGAMRGVAAARGGRGGMAMRGGRGGTRGGRGGGAVPMVATRGYATLRHEAVSPRAFHPYPLIVIPHPCPHSHALLVVVSTASRVPHKGIAPTRTTTKTPG